METNTLSITDTDLIQKLETSAIRDDQKKQLEALIPEMNETERGELLILIERSNQEITQAETTYKEGVNELNKQTAQELGRLNKDAKGEAVKAIENFDNTQNAATLENLDSAIENSDAPAQAAAPTQTPTLAAMKTMPAAPAKPNSKRFILVIAGLFGLSALILIILSAL